MSTLRLFIAKNGKVDALKCLAAAAVTKATLVPEFMTNGEYCKFAKHLGAVAAAVVNGEKFVM